MIGIVALLLAIQPPQGILLNGQPAINENVESGPPDRRLQDDIDRITGRNLCDRTIADRWKEQFDARYRARLNQLNIRLTSIFGRESMNRDYMSILSCMAFGSPDKGPKPSQLRKLEDNFRAELTAFDQELLVWEQFAATKLGKQ